jgi:hypothetical protein
VAAVDAGEAVKPLLADLDLDPKIKTFSNLSVALLALVTTMVENGIIPLSGSGNAQKSGPTPPPLPNRSLV